MCRKITSLVLDKVLRCCRHMTSTPPPTRGTVKYADGYRGLEHGRERARLEMVGKSGSFQHTDGT